MVEYIPNAPGTTPYRQVNPSPLAFFSQGLGGGLPNLMQALGERFNPQNRQKEKQQTDFMNMIIGDLMKSINPPQQGPQNAPMQGPQLPGQSFPAPSSGMGAPTDPGSMNMRTMAMIQTFAPYLAHQMAQTLFPTLKPNSTRAEAVPMIDTPYGPMTPYQWAGRKQAGDRINLYHQKMNEEWSRIQEGVAANTQREYDIQAGPLDDAAKQLKEIHQMRAKLPSTVTDEDLQDAWQRIIPKTGVVKDPLFGHVNPTLKNYVQKVYGLQQTLQKRAANTKDPHAFTYQTLLNLVPAEHLPTLPEMDQNFKSFNNNMMAIKRTVRQSAALKYRLMGMNQLATMQAQLQNDPDLMEAPEQESTQQDAVEAELYGH